MLGQKNPRSVHKPEIDLSEMMCIEILYHHSGYKCFQYYYEQEVEKGYLKSYFPDAPSYNRFVSIKAPYAITLDFLFESLQDRSAMRHLFCRFDQTGRMPQQAHTQQ